MQLWGAHEAAASWNKNGNMWKWISLLERAEITGLTLNYMRSSSEQSQHNPKHCSVEGGCGCTALSTHCCTLRWKRWWGKQSLSFLSREDICLCCFWGQQSLLHQLHKALKKQVPEAQGLAAEHSPITGADLSPVGTATGHEKNSRGSTLLWLWPPSDTAVLCSKGGWANRETHLCSEAGSREELSDLCWMPFTIRQWNIVCLIMVKDNREQRTREAAQLTPGMLC